MAEVGREEQGGEPGTEGEQVAENRGGKEGGGGDRDDGGGSEREAKKERGPAGRSKEQHLRGEVPCEWYRYRV